MQELINKYFNKLCKDKFFKNNDEKIIGKAKDVINNLNRQIEYANNIENEISEEDRKFIISESIKLIQEINITYPNKDDIIMVALHPMAGFYVLQEQETLFEELKEYYEELEEK